ncbi:protein CHLOROPLAST VESICULATION [Lycium ferocissimum]|uniref:protein CHLOROPLAST VESICULATION n=1 Tax=Lycium ferocissimum TaxID=112874 RepID=UPI00281520D5|nr:protein CHLOROPLAST VESICULATION [Lycium ferocissimum]
MAVSTKLCLNLSPQPPPTSNNSIPPPSKATQVSWQRKEKSWKSQCVLGMACVVIGLESDSLIFGNEEISAIAGDMQLHVAGKSIQKWSEKRSCPPWNGNSLETIVPENLPRPVTRRRWETVDYNTTQSAPEVKLVTKNSKGCFTM